MTRPPAVLLAGALLAWAALDGATPHVSRAAMQDIERTFDQRIQRYSIDAPMDLLGATRGVYLENYGAVLSTEVNLVVGPVLSPFRPKLTKEELERLRQRKLERLPVLKQLVRDMMVTTATRLNTIPLREQIVVGVTLFHYSWEDSSGLPGQILMQAERRNLIDFEAGRINRETLDAAITMREF